MTYYIKSGSRFTISKEANIHIEDRLPNGTYAVSFDPNTGFFLETISNFEISGKIYGDTTKRVQKIINTFEERTVNTGVLLEGDKGSGKTLLAKVVSLELMKKGIPTIIVGERYCGDKFNDFIQSIDQKCLIFIDEFEKIYDRDHQPLLLSLLDGAFNAKKLFIITCNEITRVSDYMKNRPGRFFYRYAYDGLDEKTILEYCKDNLENKDEIEKIVTISDNIQGFSFDILKAIVEEMNRYDETVMEALVDLNVEKYSTNNMFEIFSSKLVSEKSKKYRTIESSVSFGDYVNPFRDDIFISLLDLKEEYDEEDIKDEDLITFTPDDIVKVENGLFFYKDDEDNQVVIKKKKFTPRSFEDLIM